MSIEVEDHQDIKTSDNSSSEVENQLTQKDVGESSEEPLSEEIINVPKQMEKDDMKTLDVKMDFGKIKISTQIQIKLNTFNQNFNYNLLYIINFVFLQQTQMFTSLSFYVELKNMQQTLFTSCFFSRSKDGCTKINA